MNRRLIIGLLLTLATLTGNAQQRRVEGLSDNQRLLGYTVTDDIDINGAAFGEAGTYSIGAALTPTALAPYAGCHVVGIRLAAAQNLGRTRMFVYNFTGTAFDLVVEQRQRIYEGWNNVFLNGEGYEIRGDETLFFGFDYVETQAMVDAEEGALCCVGEETDGAFYLYGNYGQGEGLYSISGAGRLCVQLIIDVSTLPRNVLSLTALDAGFKYKKAGEDVEMMLNVANTGRDTIATYQLGFNIDEQEPQYADVEKTLVDGQQDVWLGSITLPDDISVGRHTLTVFVNKVNGSEPDDRRNDRLTTAFSVYADNVQRSKAYLEIYTDQNSPYVPFLNDALSQVKSKMGDMITVVNVHRPGTPLAISDAAYLCDLYAYTYPTFTINRAYFPGEAYVAYDMNDYLPVFSTEMSAGIIGDMILQDYYSPSFATVSLSGKYDADARQLTIEAEGQLLPEAQAIYGDVALTLMLSENNVQSRQTVYNIATQRTTNDKTYKHNDVLRSYITSPTGQKLTADNGTYHASFTTTLDDAWVADQLTVTALLTKAVDDVTAADIYDMDIINAASLPMSEVVQTQGIVTTGTTNSSPSAYYSLDGKRVTTNHLRPGIYIQRTPDGGTKKVNFR